MTERSLPGARFAAPADPRHEGGAAGTFWLGVLAPRSQRGQDVLTSSGHSRRIAASSAGGTTATCNLVDRHRPRHDHMEDSARDMTTRKKPGASWWRMSGAVRFALALLLAGLPGRALATSLDPNVILEFETPAAWRTRHGTAAATDVRTQGTAAYELTVPARHEQDCDEDCDQEDDDGVATDLTSAPVASTGTALAGIGEAGATFALDVLLPPAPAPRREAGSLRLVLSCRSRGIHHADLGAVHVSSSEAGIYTTVKFAIPQHVRQALAGAIYDDLTFRLKLKAPRRRSAATRYLFDNLRVHSPGMPPSGPGESVDLVALLSYSPMQSTPGVASFPVGLVQVPQSFHVKLGSAGPSGSVQLDLGYGSTPFVTCTYDAGPDGTAYHLAACSGGVDAGALIGADFASLTILSGDASAGPTKIRAQLALNPVGDTAGAGVIPPMPTFWGDTPASASQIVTDYFNAVHAAQPITTEERWIQTPVPEFARRSSDGSPHNNLLGPPPPHDPPFDQEGHLNPGGLWDAYWRLAGHLTTDNANNDNTTHFDARFSSHVVLWGDDQE